MSSWNTIESDTGVFTQLVKDLGVEGIQFEDIPYLDYLPEISNILYGVIFLFKYDPLLYQDNTPIDGEYITEEQQKANSLFFACQTINNACGTQAVLNTLLSLSKKHQEIRLGEELENFLQFTHEINDYILRGETMTNSEKIRTVHNSFTSPNMFEFHSNDSFASEKYEDTYHFIGFIPFDGIIYELDGLRKAPIIHLKYGYNNNNPHTFANTMVKLLQDRISKSNSGLNGLFSLMGIVKDKLEWLNMKLESNELNEGEKFVLKEELDDELKKRDKWCKEISIRRQNLFGLILELSKQITTKMSSSQFAEQITKAQQSNVDKISR